MAGGAENGGIPARGRGPQATPPRAGGGAPPRGGWAQLLDAGHVVGRDHLLSALEHARRAMDQGTNTTGSLEMEFLLYASGERQISKAIDLTGVRAGRPFVAVLGGPFIADVLERFGWTRDDRFLGAGTVKRRNIGFAPAEIRSAGPAATDLVLERVARVDLIK